MINLFVFSFGAIVGSFLNVLILRLPREEDVVLKSSHCTSCNKKLTWYMNIPLLSYILLRGKCRFCSAKISLQYPMIELASGIVSLLLRPKIFDIDSLYFFLFYFSVYSVFITHFIIDVRHKILPDSLNIYLLFSFAAFAFFHKSLVYSLSGFLIGLLFPLSVAYAFYKIKGVEGLGGGDIKLFAVLGVMLGPIGILQNLFLSCFLGSIIGLALIAFKIFDKNEGIPFGPSIILVASFQIFSPMHFDKFSQLIGFSF